MEQSDSINIQSSFFNLQFFLILAFLICLTAGTTAPVFAENHALLIGIGKYRQRTLEGPPFDVSSLKTMLVERYNFAEENVHTLVNDEAVRSRIMDEIKLLPRRTRPGDGVFIYYSGHGTSHHDEIMALPLPHSTGALVPADFDGAPGQPAQKQLSQLIIGKRDLRPTLERLDRDRNVLMIFDTCFSGNTVRGPKTPAALNSSRHMRLQTKSVFRAEREIGGFYENLKPNEFYPYQNIFYISASAEYEIAHDIRRETLRLYPTYDGKPHGVLTDALLRVLAGQRPVDMDKDGQWSQFEIYSAVSTEVKRRFKQSPQVLPRKTGLAERLYARPFFVRSTVAIAESSLRPAGAKTGNRIPKSNNHLDYSSSHALVVGINNYHRWPRLEYAAKDAREMSALLKSQGFQVRLLTDEQATRHNILASLDSIGDSVDQNSRVVFYFAGHGQTEDLPGGRERGYLVPVDAGEYDWQSTMLPMEQLNRRVKQLSAKHILMAFDSCYSGLGLVRSVARYPDQDSIYIRKMMRTRSVQVLTAGSRSEQAIEAAGHGLFTDQLLAALSGAADINDDGYITATEIYAVLRPGITQKSYSRQTPQFGYIEGNGDIIFRITPPKTPAATVLIDNRINGINVWADTNEIGHLLPAGRHQLHAPDGLTAIIVKKGARTLYRKSVRLAANQTFRIRIDSDEHQTVGWEAYPMQTIAHRKIANFSNSIAFDLDSDGREEIITASGKHLYAFQSDGSVVWHKSFKAPVTLDLIDYWNSQPAIGVTVVRYNKVHLMLLNSDGRKIWHRGRKIIHYHRGRLDGDGSIARLVDIDGDGRKEVIAITRARHGLKPRGLVVYNQAGDRLWRYTIGPSLQNLVVWEKDHGRPDIIIGTYSPANGNHEFHNNTSDLQTYVISIDGYGKTNWVMQVGEFYNGVGLLLADPVGTGNQALYAHKFTSSSFREDTGAIFRISRSGKLLSQFKSKHSIVSITADPSAGSDQGFLYAADNNGGLYQLDEQLNLLHKRTIETGSPPPELRLVGVHDYDGDGSSELLLYSFSCLLSDRNPLTIKRSNRKAFYSNLKFQVVSRDFSRLLKSVSFGEDWGQLHGFAVKNIQRPEMQNYPFMALSDRIILVNY
ncbi:MAG: caspase family protein [bacterium]|nr:caspase family protein [bacterium]